MFITLHALDRYRKHHPLAKSSNIRASIDGGEDVTPELVQALLARRGSDHTARYVLTEDKWGIFVIVQDRVLTYLRLGEAQRRVLTEPAGTPVLAKRGPSHTRRSKLYALVECLGVSVVSLNPTMTLRALFGDLDAFRTEVLQAVTIRRDGEWVLVSAGGHDFWYRGNGVCYTTSEYANIRSAQEAKEATRVARLSQMESQYLKDLEARYGISS